MADTIHTRITKAREAKGLKQKELALRVGVSPQSVSQWEGGSQTPSQHNINRLSIVLGVSINYLYGREDLNSHLNENSIISVDMSLGAEIPLLPLDELMNLNSDKIIGKKHSRGKKVHTARQWSEQARAFTMVDDSMEPKFSEGDIITIDPEENFGPGECIAAFIRPLGITVFRQFRYDGPDHCILASLNDHYRSYRFTHQEWTDDVVVIGPWVEHTAINDRSPKRHSS